MAEKPDDRPEWVKGTAVIVPGLPRSPGVDILRVTPEMLGKLADDLTQAYGTGTTKGEAGNNWRRLGAIQSLNAIMSFLSSAGFRSELLANLLILEAALCDASEGRSNAVLRPSKFMGGSKKGFMESHRMAAAAAVVTFLVTDLHWEFGLALKRTAAAVKKSPKQLEDFRKNVMAKRAPEYAVPSYWESLADFRARPDTGSSEEWGRRLILALKQTSDDLKEV